MREQIPGDIPIVLPFLIGHTRLRAGYTLRKDVCTGEDFTNSISYKPATF